MTSHVSQLMVNMAGEWTIGGDWQRMWLCYFTAVDVVKRKTLGYLAGNLKGTGRDRAVQSWTCGLGQRATERLPGVHMAGFGQLDVGIGHKLINHGEYLHTTATIVGNYEHMTADLVAKF